jgi:acetyltransferase-like isoleucine patch superfamily enzyme
MFRLFFSALLACLPWPLRRWVLNTFYGYKIHRTARLGFCFPVAKHLIMEEHSRIGHLTVCVHLDLVHLKAHASIGRGNWITGFPTGGGKHFAHQTGRHAELIVGEHSAITNRHLIDCTDRVTLGRFTTFAGFRSQILAHSIDLAECRQSARPVTIGDYCFVGTDCVLLGGSALPDCSVLAAKSLLNKPQSEPYTLYGGVPARALRSLPREFRYFTRTTGSVE